MNPTLKYQEGYKYQVYEDYSIQTTVKPKEVIFSDFIVLEENGMIHIKKGYAWDGASGPAIDTKNFRIGSLIHDALYQLMDEKQLNPKIYKELADKELVRLTRNDKMSKFRCWWVFEAVDYGGGRSGWTKNPVLTAPI